MTIEQRSYSGKSFRPKPLVGFEEQTQSTVIVTSWNAPDPAAKVLQLVKDFLAMTSDSEATLAGQYIEGLGPTANRLRNAAIFANENIFSNDNRTEYVAGVELAAFSVHKNVLSWVQIGAPHLILTGSRGLQPICYTPDGAWQLQQEVPLLCSGLGIEKSIQINCGSYRLQGDEQLVMVSRSHIPAALFAMNSGAHIEGISRILADDNSETPFWIAISQLTA